MRPRLEHLLAIGTAMCAVGLSFQAFAAAVEPIEVQGKPSAQIVAELCQFPKVINKGEISSPVEVAIQSPETGTFPKEGPLHGIFRISITVDENVLSFEDISNDPGSPNSTNSQFYDILGTEAIVVTSETSANVYCNVNSIRDSNLLPPSDPLVAVSAFWVIGPSGFENQGDLDLVCSALNSAPERVTDFFIGHHTRNDPRIRRPVTLDAPIDFNGCNDKVPRFCNPQDTRGDGSVIRCNFAGFDLITDSTVLGSCGGSSGGSKIKC
jgi:hypothetical protein